ncbi:MAG: cellulase family glycosylhydrolase [Capsulimonadaceae bacterium]|nr:cellulase family glycosylhydrolase [Capsulimonadaceae bacterium]
MKLCMLVIAAALTFATTTPVFAAAKRGDVLYTCDFGKPASDAGWQGLSSPSVSWDQAATCGKALRITIPAGQPGNASVTRSLDVSTLRGLRVVVSAHVKAYDIVKPEHPWNGVKVMLVVKAPSGTGYSQKNEVYGTFDWNEIRFGAEIPEDASSAELVLGIENTSGRAEFSDVRITVLEAPRAAANAAAKAAVYTGHAAPRLRGAMLGHADEEGVAKFANVWKANLFRYQLGGSRPGGPEADLGPAYDKWLDSRLSDLDKFLPLAQKYGVLVLVDMHSQPGGRISPFEGDRIFADVRYQDKLAEAWEKISKRYRGNPAVWGYDLCNEPLERTTPENVPGWQALATRLAKIVRRNDPDHAIIVESMNADPSEFRYLNPIPVKNIVYSVHFYEPGGYTMQGVGGAWAKVDYPGKISGKTWDKASLAEALQPVVDFQKQCHAAIYVGEFSAVRWAPNSTQWLRDAIDIFEAHHWDWSYHAFREWSGWDAEYPSDHDATARSETPTERETLLKSYYALNASPRVAGR